MSQSELIQVLQLKPGNKPHMSWQAVHLAANDAWLAVLAEPGTPVQHHTRGLNYMLPHYCISLFSRNEHFNVMLDFHADGTFKHAYINIAEPATWRDGTVRALDLDLDILVSPEGITTLVDEDEFAESIAAGKYNETTITIAQKTAERLMQIATHNAFPFVRSDMARAKIQIKDYLATQASAV
jgi:protein associated with RNAse G/E